MRFPSSIFVSVSLFTAETTAALYLSSTYSSAGDRIWQGLTLLFTLLASVLVQLALTFIHRDLSRDRPLVLLLHILQLGPVVRLVRFYSVPAWVCKCALRGRMGLRPRACYFRVSLCLCGPLIKHMMLLSSAPSLSLCACSDVCVIQTGSEELINRSSIRPVTASHPKSSLIYAQRQRPLDSLQAPLNGTVQLFTQSCAVQQNHLLQLQGQELRAHITAPKDNRRFFFVCALKNNLISSGFKGTPATFS